MEGKEQQLWQSTPKIKLKNTLSHLHKKERNTPLCFFCIPQDTNWTIIIIIIGQSYTRNTILQVWSSIVARFTCKYELGHTRIGGYYTEYLHTQITIIGDQCEFQRHTLYGIPKGRAGQTSVHFTRADNCINPSILTEDHSFFPE